MNKTNLPAAPYAPANRDNNAETQADIYAPAAPAPRPPQDTGIVTRASLVVVLSLTLVGAMRWALNITNANAKQISTGLTRLQGQYDARAQTGWNANVSETGKPSTAGAFGRSYTGRASTHSANTHSANGPSIEPEGR